MGQAIIWAIQRQFKLQATEAYKVLYSKIDNCRTIYKQYRVRSKGKKKKKDKKSKKQKSAKKGKKSKKKKTHG